MLGKLLKYDMRSMRRYVLPLVLATPVVAILGSLALRFTLAVLISEPNSPLSNVITMTASVFIAVSVIAVAASPVIAVICIMMHFYRSLYTDEGYLTFTLPLKTHQILDSKIISGFFWGIISSLSFLVSGLIFIIFGTTTDTLVNKEIIDTLFSNSPGAVFGIPTPIYGTALCFNAISSELFLIVTLSLSVTIGSIVSRKHKILSSVAVYYILNTVSSLLSGIVSFILVLTASNGSDGATLAYMTMATPMVSIIFNLGFSAAAYTACCYLMKNRLNLD